MLQVKVKVKTIEMLGKHFIGRKQSRHPFAVILLLTTLWRLPSCIADMLFCDYDYQTALRGKVEGQKSSNFCIYTIVS